MSVRIVCPACGAADRVPDDRLGKKIRCRECDEVILAAAADPPDGIRTRPRRPAAADADERPRPARRRADPDDDGEVPARRAPKRRRSKKRVSPVVIFAATLSLLVILVAGGVGSFYLFEHGSPPPKVDPGQAAGPLWPPNMDENPFLERQGHEHLEAFFRAPEEPPLDRLEFAEPPPAAAGAEPPEPGANAGGQLAADVLQKVKEATVYVQVKTAMFQGSGSGFFAGEPGFVVTNAHVVGMLGRDAPPPTSVEVVRNKGEQNEVTLTARVVAVDPDVDLAVLSVPKEGLPPPLPVKSAESLRETQTVYVFGFPLGELPGKNVTVNEYKLSSLKKEKGVLEKLQIHGEMMPGNSGGPVVDAGGSVVGVCVAILVDQRLGNTHINFAIPGGKVLRFLDGRLAELSLETPARAGDGLRVPVAVRLIDPLGHVRRAAVDYWVGKPGPGRTGGRTAPQAQPGDGPRQTVALELRQQAGRGELALPPLPAGQAYWLQPNLFGRGGARVWLSAQVYRPPAPVERKPARLAWQPAGERRLVFERWSVLQYTDLHQGHDRRGLLTTEVRLTDTPGARQGNDLAVYRQFTGLKEGVSIDGQVYMTGRLEHVPANLPLLADNLVVDAQGITQHYEIDVKLKDAPPASKRHLSALEQDVEKFLRALEVPLPGKEVRPGETWSGRCPLPYDATWKALGVLPAQAWATADGASLEMTYTYEGVRAVGGTERAVVRLRGQAAEQAGGARDSGTPLSGTAVIDPATGQVVEEEVTALSNVEVAFLNTVVIKAQGTVLARLRQE